MLPDTITIRSPTCGASTLSERDNIRLETLVLIRPTKLIKIMEKEQTLISLRLKVANARRSVQKYFACLGCHLLAALLFYEVLTRYNNHVQPRRYGELA